VLTIGNNGTAQLNVTLTIDEPWLILTPSTGSLDVLDTMDCIVQVNASSLSPGFYTNTISVSSNDPDEGMISIPVSLIVNPEQHAVAVINLTVNDTLYYLEETLITTTIENRGLSNESNVEVQLIINDVSIETKTLDTLFLSESKEVIFSYTPNEQDILDVMVLVLPVPGEQCIEDNTMETHTECIRVPRVWISPESYQLTLMQGESKEQTLMIGNTGTTDLLFTLDYTAPWLSITPDMGTVSVSDSLECLLVVDVGALPVGEHATVIILNTNDPGKQQVAIPLYLTVTRATHNLAVASVETDMIIPLGEAIIVQTTIENIGLEDESNLSVYFLCNDKVIHEESIAVLGSLDSMDFTFSHTLKDIGMLTIMISIPSVPGEILIDDNTWEKELLITPSGWSMFGHDAAGTGVSSAPGFETLSFAWAADDSEWITTSPIVVDDRVFIGTSDGDALYCFDATTGTVLWSTMSGESITSSPAIYEEYVVVASDNGVVSCLRVDTGELEWMKELEANKRVDAPVTVAEEKVFVAVNTISYPLKTEIYCFNVLTGDLLWISDSFYDKILVSPTYHNDESIYGGLLFFGTSKDSYGVYGGEIICLIADNGELFWRYQTNGDTIISSPCVVRFKDDPSLGTQKTRLYVGVNKEGMYCFDANPDDNDDGKINGFSDVDEGYDDHPSVKYDVIWKKHVHDHALFSSPIVDVINQNLFFATTQSGLSYVYCFHASPDEDDFYLKKWDTQIGSGLGTDVLLNAPSLTDNKFIYIASSYGFFIIDASSGEILSNMTLECIRSHAVGDQGQVFLCNHHDLICLSPYPVVMEALSSQDHGSSGEFSIDVLTDNAIEHRWQGPTQVQVTFDQPVQFSGGMSLDDVQLSSGNVEDLTIDDSLLIIALNEVNNAEYLTVTFPGIESTTCIGVTDELTFGVLAGDVNADGIVNAVDVAVIRNPGNWLKSLSDAENPRCDINCDGCINGLDISIIRGPWCWDKKLQ